MMSVSLRSNQDKPFLGRDALWLDGLVLASMFVYLGLSAITYRIGFPLDDSWIHQTYARNFALRGEWAFVPGEISAGSTSPLWTILLALGFVLNLSPYLWTFFLGGILLFGISVLVEIILRRSILFYKPTFPWAGSIFVLEWHFVWAAFSGMETSLYIFLVLFVMINLFSHSRNYLFSGMLVGVALWVRPDGLTLLGPLALMILLTEATFLDRLRCLLRLSFGFGVFFFPYLLFNLAISGTPMPNTFYAKQAEYVGWNLLPFGTRVWFFALQYFQGVSLFFIPGFFYKLINAFQERKWGLISAAIWMFGTILMYLLRLPVYQHGRYLMPALSIFIIIGFCGFLDALAWLRSRQLYRLTVACLAAVTIILTISFGFGGIIYSQDVAFIESQMVDTARWVAQNLPHSSKIAAHDIGALGFFGEHPIIDLAGLITPDVIPIINDGERLSNYLCEHGVQYLVAFMDWKPEISREARYFVAQNKFNSQSGYGSMGVFGWNQP